MVDKEGVPRMVITEEEKKNKEEDADHGGGRKWRAMDQMGNKVPTRKEKNKKKEREGFKKNQEELATVAAGIMKSQEQQYADMEAKKKCIRLMKPPDGKKAWYWRLLSHPVINPISVKVHFPDGSSSLSYPAGLLQMESNEFKSKAHKNYICWVCFFGHGEEMCKPLAACFKVVSGANGLNLFSHLKSHTNLTEDTHGDWVQAIALQERGTPLLGAMTVTVTTAVAAGASEDTTPHIAAQAKCHPFDNAKRKPKTPEEVQLAFHMTMVWFINNQGLPDNTCEKPEFHAMMEYCARNADLIGKIKGYCKMGRTQYETVCQISSVKMITMIKGKISQVNSYYQQLYGKQVAFVHTGFDHYDGWNDCLGVSIMLIDPLCYGGQWGHVRLAVAIVEADGHTRATNTADQALHELKEKAGVIEPAMILSTGVDTTNSALLTSWLVKNKKNTAAAAAPVEDEDADECQMHKVSLVYGHGFGVLTWTKRKRIIDRFDAAEDLQKQAHTFVSHVNDTTTFKKYKDIQLNKDDCIALNLPCSTHVCGTQFMYESLLQSKPNLSFAQFNHIFSDDKCHSEEHWKQVAEFEAIARPLAMLSKKVQTDRAGSLAETLIHVEMARYVYTKTSPSFHVVDLSTHANWLPKTKYKDLVKRKVKLEDLSSEGQDLIKRFAKELERYFPADNWPRLELLVMALHLVMANVILSAMAWQNPALGNIVQKSKEALKNSLLELGVPPTLKCRYGLDQPYLSSNNASVAGISPQKGSGGERKWQCWWWQWRQQCLVSLIRLVSLIGWFLWYVSSYQRQHGPQKQWLPTTNSWVCHQPWDWKIFQPRQHAMGTIRTTPAAHIVCWHGRGAKALGGVHQKGSCISNQDLIACFKTLFWWSDVNKVEFPLIAHLATQHPTPTHFKNAFSVPAVGLLMRFGQSLASKSSSSKFFLPWMTIFARSKILLKNERGGR
jgi:hypothetical protein